jgi:AcrR family transcriptional regulator
VKGKTDVLGSIKKKALQLFTSQGIFATSTAQIAREAKVANGTLFYYFPSKDHLIDALYIECVDSFWNGASALVESPPDPKKILRDTLLAYIRWAIDHTEQFRFIHQYATFIPNKGDLKLKVFEKIDFLSLFDTGVKQGLLKPMPASLLVDIWIAITNGLARHFIETGKTEPDENSLNMAWETSWDSVRRIS